jgi:hypothetical protein
MKKFASALLLSTALVCPASAGNVDDLAGYSTHGSVLTGQVKKVEQVTPLLCPRREDVDVSLGVMRNGVGSVSTQDVWLTVPGTWQQVLSEDALTKGVIVEITYDTRRFTVCGQEKLATRVRRLGLD